MGIKLYKGYQEQLRTGDLLSWGSDSVLGWMIKKFTKSDVNHSGMVVRFSDYESQQTTAGRRFTLEALGPGIVLNLISRRFESYEGKVYWHPLKKQYWSKRIILGENSLQYVGIKYDTGSLIKNIVGRVSAEASKLFCSEYVYINGTECGLHPECDDTRFLISLAQGKAPTPADMPKLGWWEPRIRIF